MQVPCVSHSVRCSCLGYISACVILRGSKHADSTGIAESGRLRGSGMCHGDLPCPDTWRRVVQRRRGRVRRLGSCTRPLAGPRLALSSSGRRALCALRRPPHPFRRDLKGPPGGPAPIPPLPCRLAAVRHVRMEGGRRQQGPPPQPSGRRRLRITWVAVGLGQLSFAGVTD